MSSSPIFPNYLETSDKTEAEARIQAFVPLEFVFETLKTRDDTRSMMMEGAEAEVGNLIEMMTELAEQKDWQLKACADGSSRFVADSGDSYLSIHLRTDEDGGGFSETSKRSNRYQETPDWLINLVPTPYGLEARVLKFDPKYHVPPKYDGSVHFFPAIPEDWNPFWKCGRMG